MATAVQQNLVDKNAEYASGFQEGHLALPPAKNYAVGKCSSAGEMKAFKRNTEDACEDGRLTRPSCNP